VFTLLVPTSPAQFKDTCFIANKTTIFIYFYGLQNSLFFMDNFSATPIFYNNNKAFTSCICGNELVLIQIPNQKATYGGSCGCGRKFELINNTLQSLKI